MGENIIHIILLKIDIPVHPYPYLFLNEIFRLIATFSIELCYLQNRMNRIHVFRMVQLTCSLTLVVSRGKVKISAIQAPAPALTTLTHSGVGVPSTLGGRECSWCRTVWCELIVTNRWPVTLVPLSAGVTYSYKD